MLFRTYCRLMVRLAVAGGVLLVPAAPGGQAARYPVREHVAQSPTPPTVTSPVATARIELLPPWNGPSVLPAMPQSGLREGLVAASIPDVTDVPEPSVIVLLLGGLAIATMARRPRRIS